MYYLALTTLWGQRTTQEQVSHLRNAQVRYIQDMWSLSHSLLQYDNGYTMKSKQHRMGHPLP
jgi:hypothetical protein